MCIRDSQRVALAVALVGRPDMLFLDEPTAGLDPETRPVVHDVVREQTDRGAAVLLTTHLLDDAERLADDVAILRAGRVVRSGSLAELTRVAEGDVVDVDFGDASPDAVRAWADTLPAPLRAAGLGESARLRVAGVRGPDDLAVLAASWREHALMPTRFERAGLRLEQILRETAA